MSKGDYSVLQLRKVPLSGVPFRDSATHCEMVPPLGGRGEFQWSVRGSVMMTVHNQHPDHWRFHCGVCAA